MNTLDAAICVDLFPMLNPPGMGDFSMDDMWFWLYQTKSVQCFGRLKFKKKNQPNLLRSHHIILFLLLLVILLVSRYSLYILNVIPDVIAQNAHFQLK